jgi:hypothetical protein
MVACPLAIASINCPKILRNIFIIPGRLWTNKMKCLTYEDHIGNNFTGILNLIT